MVDTESKEQVRVAVYSSFVREGRAPTIVELVRLTDLDIMLVREHLASLHDSRDLVLSGPALESFRTAWPEHDSDPRAILMAHPFSTIPLGFSVMGKSVLWWGGCGWDSFALAHLIPDQGPMLISTRCPGCSKPIALDVDSASPPRSSAVCHFLIPTSRMWDDVIHTCGHQRIFCDEQCVDEWLSEKGETKGYVMSMDQLWRFASKWYEGRLDAGYRRKEPSEAKEYFRSVGLSGPFWGL